MEATFTIIDVSRLYPSSMSVKEACDKYATSMASGTTLEPFVGPCAVVKLFGDDASLISEQEATDALDYISGEWKRLKTQYGGNVQQPVRVLFRTRRTGDTSEGRYFSPEAITKLLESDIILTGVDTPSLSPLDAPGEALKRFQTAQRACLINLNLFDAEQGILYNLLAPPLLVPNEPLVPVRALLTSSF
ncbi:MAG: hypothetical protein K2W95_12870 [Candidatus Obscuribacterales bacterium]|nr:hypothetical protein [Candidatus Obscuribacterales bacterium]